MFSKYHHQFHLLLLFVFLHLVRKLCMLGMSICIHTHVCVYGCGYPQIWTWMWRIDDNINFSFNFFQSFFSLFLEIRDTTELGYSCPHICSVPWVNVFICIVVIQTILASNFVFLSKYMTKILKYGNIYLGWEF